MLAFAIALIFASLSPAYALEMNSTSFKIRSEALESGATANSSGFNLSVATGISGAANSSGFSLCVGFHCTSPHIQLSALTATSSGWNSQFNFTSLVTTTDNITANITLWISSNNITWTKVEDKTCAFCNSTQVAFSKSDYACGDIGTRYIKINGTTGFLTYDATLSFSVNKGTIYASNIEYVEGHNTSVAVNNPRNITVRLFNAFNSSYVNNVSTRVWVNDTNVTEKITCTTNSTGHCRFRFQPSCSFAEGAKDLIAGVQSDACFLDVNTSIQKINVTVGGVVCDRRLTFSLSFNISGPANDSAVAGEKGPGFYNPEDLTKYYSCVDDKSLAEDPAFGIVFAGRQLNYVNVSSGDQFTLKISQFDRNATYLLPATIGSCTVINQSTPVSGLPPAFKEFIAEEGQVQLVLRYPVDIIGNASHGGAFTLIIEKNDTDDNKITIEVV